MNTVKLQGKINLQHGTDKERNTLFQSLKLNFSLLEAWYKTESA